MPERPLPPPEERITLKEAGERFDPPKSKKAVEQLLQRGSLDFAREVDEEGGRARRVVTTLEWLREYVASSSGRARLREGGPSAAPTVLFDRMRTPPASSTAGREDALQRVIHELNEELLRLRLRVAELEAELERRTT